MARKDLDSDFVSADDAATEILDTATKATPWWALSLGFHGLVLAMLPLIICVNGHIVDTSEPTVITMGPRKAPPITIPSEAPPGMRNIESDAPADPDAREEPEINHPNA